MTDHIFTLASGRNLGVTSLGDPASTRVVVLCHPMPGAGDFDPNPTVSVASGARILAFDRPGYGGSEPLRSGESTRVQARADEIAEFLVSNQLAGDRGAEYRFGAVGWGFGGAVALSLAARHPTLISRVTTVGLGRRGLGSRKGAPLPRLIGEPPDPGPRSFAWDALGIDSKDPALEFSGATERLDNMLAQAAVQGMAGIQTDALAIKDSTWIQELASITASTLLVYGAGDRFTDTASGRWLKSRLPHARTARVRDARGLTIVGVWRRILESVVPR